MDTQKYDVMVIGAGLGGLSAAGYLAKAGKKIMGTKKSPIFAGIMLIGLGILAFTGWWWPGIMLLIGTAIGVDKFLQGKIKEAIGLFLLFLAISTAVFTFSSHLLPWTVFAPILLVGIGIIFIGRSLLNKAQY